MGASTRTVCKNVLLLLVSVVFSLLLSEAGLRFFYPHKPFEQIGGFIPVPGTRHYLLQENYFKSIDDRMGHTIYANNLWNP